MPEHEYGPKITGVVAPTTHVGLPNFCGQFDYVLRLRIWQAGSYLIGLMFPRAL